MQHQVNFFSKACDNFGLTRKLKSFSNQNQHEESNVFVKDQKLPAVENFTYLGSTLSKKANIDPEVDNRISKASASFGRLTKSLWERRRLGLNTKLMAHSTVVFTTLPYASL